MKRIKIENILGHGLGPYLGESPDLLLPLAEIL